MDTELARLIGQEARRARLARRLTQQDVAERAGISVEFYARIERGQTLPSVPTLRVLAEVLGTTADALLGRLGEAAPLKAADISASGEDLSPEIRRVVRHLVAGGPVLQRTIAQLLSGIERVLSEARR